ncbi:MAG: acetolactate synthase small subunit [bacterium]
MKNDNPIRRHIITALVDNQPGVLARVVGLISGRGYNIESLNVGPTHDPSISRITMQVPGDDHVLEQVTKQLDKQVDVIKVIDLTKAPFLNRECILVKVASRRSDRSKIIELTDVFGGKVISAQASTLVIQLVGEQQQIEDFMELLKPYKIMDVSRSGVIAMAKD